MGGAAYLPHRSAPRFLLTQPLETQPRLKFNDPARQRAAGLTEVGVVDGCVVRISRERDKVKLVEHVEEIDAKIELCAFTTDEWYPCGFDETHIKTLVTRSTEGIAMNKRWPYSADVEVRFARDRAIGGIAICAGDYARKVSARFLEGIGAEITSGAPEISCRKGRAQRATRWNRRTLVALDRRPREAAMELIGSIDAPATKGPSQGIIAVPKNRKVIKPGEQHIVCHIVV